MFEFQPIGFVNSWYKVKNGTPRQSSVCPESKGLIKINKTFFDKPWNSLIDLNKFSHVWIIFYFHKNTNKKIRAKIKPPRLNGESTGLFATRSPHRPNPIGLSLVKIEKIENDTIYISGIDILDETPVIDIKPYIYDYDYPKSINQDNVVIDLLEKDKISLNENISEAHQKCIKLESDLVEKKETLELKIEKIKIKNDIEIDEAKTQNNIQVDEAKTQNDIQVDEAKVQNDIQTEKFINKKRIDENPEWINQKGVIYETPKTNNLNKENSFKVIFTERSLNQLNLFHNKTSDKHLMNFKIDDVKNVKNFYLDFKKQSNDLEKNLINEIKNGSLKCKYCLEYLNTTDEAKNAINNILQEDPRSTYRRLKCSDRLYFITVDTIHITCWFDEEEKLIEIIKIKPNLI